MPARTAKGKTAKGKIARDQWPAIAARRRAGESFASIARTYGCTAPAIRYIVEHEPVLTGGRRSGKEKAGLPDAAEAGEDVPVGAIESVLRDRVKGDIAAFLVAFETVLDNATAQNRRALLEVTDRLMHSGARIRIRLAG
jgi:hypothetical protein